ncbi:MAG: hypothetical protein KJP06_04795 [Deltaproteobacteria bacterium]|nr:hypothetical protein [Deltaproteobacteria bacterium]
MPVNNKLSNDNIRKQLDRILASKGFSRSERLRAFLRFVVEATLNEQTDRVKAYTIATEVFGRQADFDPQGDPIVRIEAGRLRRRLEHYYGTDGRNDSILIEVPKGAYVAVFRSRPVTGDVAPNHKAMSQSKSLERVEPDLSKRPSMAVMPLLNLNKDENLDFFTYGLGEELSSNLSLIQGLFVVAHYSMMQYKGQTLDLRQVGREQNVDYLITGSLYRGEERVRLALQLTSTRTGEQIWGKRFDITLSASNLLKLRDKITRRVVSSVADNYGGVVQTLWSASKEKTARSLTAYEAVLRHYFYNLHLTAETIADGKEALEHAVTIDPGYALAWAMLGEVHCDRHLYHYLSKAKNALQKAAECVQKAISIDPYCQYAYFTKSVLSIIQKDRNTAITAAEQIIALNPDAAFMVGAAGVCLTFASEYERGIECIHKSIKMGPVYPGWFHFVPFADYFLKGKYEQALVEAKKINMTGWFWDPLLRTAALGQMGRIKHAQAAYSELLTINPDFEKNASYYVYAVLMDDTLTERLFEGLYKAGLSKMKSP